MKYEKSLKELLTERLDSFAGQTSEVPKSQSHSKTNLYLDRTEEKEKKNHLFYLFIHNVLFNQCSPYQSLGPWIHTIKSTIIQYKRSKK